MDGWVDFMDGLLLGWGDSNLLLQKGINIKLFYKNWNNGKMENAAKSFILSFFSIPIKFKLEIIN